MGEGSGGGGTSPDSPIPAFPRQGGRGLQVPLPLPVSLPGEGQGEGGKVCPDLRYPCSSLTGTNRITMLVVVEAGEWGEVVWISRGLYVMKPFGALIWLAATVFV
jgi:hypothetical protein